MADAFQHLSNDIFLILLVGLLAGLLCQRLGISMLVGYLLAGIVLGDGGLGWISGKHEIEYIAHAGVLLLLFAIGIEFSLEELARLGRHLLIGGGLQMLLVSGSVAGILWWLGYDWKWCLLVGSIMSLSSTVLVFKALTEEGQLHTPHGKRGVGVLLFQDIAIVPLLLLLPFLTGKGEGLGWSDAGWLLLKSALFIAATILFRFVLKRWIVQFFASSKRLEFVLIFSIVTLSAACLLAEALGLQAAVGALAAGLAFSGNRMTSQVDALLLPFRETFAAIFFVSLGLLLRPGVLLSQLHLLLPLLLGLLTLKTAAAALALRAAGLTWRNALAMGLGLSQVGELSFVLVLQSGSALAGSYQEILFLAMASLLLTPPLIRFALGKVEKQADSTAEGAAGHDPSQPIEHAVVVGGGPVSSRVASHLDTTGYDVCVVDLNPMNLYRCSQAGLLTVVGDATQDTVLQSARVAEAEVVVVCVSEDDAAKRIVKSVRKANKGAVLLVRCRFLSNITDIRQAGAHHVISEEQRSAEEILRLLQIEESAKRDENPEA